MGPFQHVGIAAATVVSSWLNVAIMAYVLRRRGHLVLDRRLRERLWRMALATAGMGVALFGALGPLADVLAGTTSERVLGLAVMVIGGMAVFGVLALALGAARIGDLKSLYRGGATP